MNLVLDPELMTLYWFLASLAVLGVLSLYAVTLLMDHAIKQLSRSTKHGKGR